MCDAQISSDVKYCPNCGAHKKNN
ncbi:MAG: zinc-ribbon domain-containing protein [Candidatus Bathyarchaeia archaeon]